VRELLQAMFFPSNGLLPVYALKQFSDLYQNLTKFAATENGMMLKESRS
jgi:hypothetical protein